MSLEQKKVAFIGAGAMGSALMKGIINKGVVKARQVLASDVDGKRLAELQEQLGITPLADNTQLLSQADLVVVAVKPQVMAQVLQPLAGSWRKDQLVISIAAGITLDQLETMLGEDVSVIRVMPNTPSLVGAGATGISLGAKASAEDAELARELFAAVGETVVLGEELLDAVIGVSGSGPAYCYLFIEALTDGGVREGLPRPVAQRLAAQTLLGAARMVLETGSHPGELKDMVTSPGGTTIAAVGLLEKNGFRGMVMDAVATASRRAREMAKNQ